MYIEFKFNKKISSLILRKEIYIKKNIFFIFVSL